MFFGVINLYAKNVAISSHLRSTDVFGSRIMVVDKREDYLHAREQIRERKRQQLVLLRAHDFSIREVTIFPLRYVHADTSYVSMN